MFIVIEERNFRASHRLQMADGNWEDLHEHDWLVRVCVKSQKLDEQKLVVDFLDLQKYLDQILGSYEGKELGKVSPFNKGQNPSAEYVAWQIYSQLAPNINSEHATLYRVEVREAPTSWGIYEIDS